MKRLVPYIRTSDGAISASATESTMPAVTPWSLMYTSKT